MKRWNNDFKIDEMLEQMRQTNQREGILIQYPPEILDWVVQLKLLNGVPLSCLVGDEKQLPPESIRFFYVDENWTDQLVNGALSVGADDAKARSVNACFTAELHKSGMENLHIARERRIHEIQKRFYRRNRMEPENQEITGFLMRSRLVRLWKGLESAAFDKNGNPLAILRMEQLSEEIMICMYRGELAKLRVKEPKEGLRFGAHENDRTIRVRDIKPGNEGRPIPDKNVAIRTNAYGRADILALTEELKKILNTEHLTSAELAMELIVAPGLAEFDRT